MSNDPDAEEPPEPTCEIECHAWDVKALIAAQLRSLVRYVEQPRSMLTAEMLRSRFDRMEELASIYEDLTRPPSYFPPVTQRGLQDDEVPF